MPRPPDRDRRAPPCGPCWPSSRITTTAIDRIAAWGWRVPCPAASEPVAGWCRGPSWAACTTSTRGPLERGWSFAALRDQDPGNQDLQVSASAGVADHLAFVHHDAPRALEQLRDVDQEHRQLLVSHYSDVKAAQPDVVVVLRPVTSRYDDREEVAIALPKAGIVLLGQGLHRHGEDGMAPAIQRNAGRRHLTN